MTEERIEDVLVIEKSPLSPVGLCIDLKRPLRIEREGYAFDLEAASWLLMDKEGHLGYFDYGELTEAFSEMEADAKERGAWEEDEDGNVAIKGDFSVNISAHFLRVEGAPVKAEELVVCAAVDVTRDADKARALIDSFYSSNPFVRRVGEEEDRQNLPTIKTHQIKSTEFPLDKANEWIWKMLEGAASGQYGFELDEFAEEEDVYAVGFNVAKAGSDAPIVVTYMIDFSELDGSITKKLEPYDKRVCMAVAALFNAGYEYMTLRQIYNAMGNKGNPGKADKKKISESLTKMSGAKMHLSNQEEARVYNRDTFTYEGPVVPMEKVERASVDGQIVEGVIHVFREPPPISFAKERKQFTTINIGLLDTPLSLTSGNIQLEDYLIERISHIRNGRINKKLLYETIYKNTGITTGMQRSRAPEKIRKVLEHFTSMNWIAGYELLDDGVNIIV